MSSKNPNGSDPPPPIILTHLRQLAPGELESQERRRFSQEISQVVIEHLKHKIIHVENEGKGKAKAKAKVEKTGWKRYAGLLFAVLAALCVSLLSLTSKMLTKRGYHTFSIGLWSCQGMTFGGVLSLIYFRFVKKEPIFDSVWPLSTPGAIRTCLLLVARTTAGFFSTLFIVQSLYYLKLADATVVASSTPIAVAILARIFLGEKCGIIPMVTALVTLSGVVILTRPPMLTGAAEFDENILIGTGLALGCMFCLTTVYIILRFVREVHVSVSISAYGFIASIESIILLSCIGVFEIPETQEEWIIVGINAFSCILSQFFITLALKFEEAGPVSLVRTIEILFSFGWQIIFLGVSTDMISVIGATIIMIGIIVTAIRKWIKTLPEDHASRKWLWFLLK